VGLGVQPDVINKTENTRAPSMGWRKRTYAEEMLAAAAAALADAGRDGASAPASDGLARAVLVRPRRSARQAAAAPAVTDAATVEAERGPAAGDIVGAANGDSAGACYSNVNADGGGCRRRDRSSASPARDDRAIRLGAACLRNARSGASYGDGGRGDSGEDGVGARAVVGQCRVTFSGVDGDRKKAGSGGPGRTGEAGAAASAVDSSGRGRGKNDGGGVGEASLGAACPSPTRTRATPAAARRHYCGNVG